MPIKYIPYYPDTIEGQAILDNFARTRRILKYRDADKAVDKVRRGMPLYEMALEERVGTNADGNLIIRGECVSACAYLKEQGVEIDLVYIDPPFASGADYAKKVYIRRNPKVAEAIAKAEEELQDEDLRAFDEKMYGDVWDKEKYLNWMYENLMAIKSVMSDTASIYVHLDWHIVHYVKILMDEIFCEENFRNEIVWCYKTTLKGSDLNYGRDHDTILFYANDEKVKVHPDKSDFPVSESTIKRWGDYADEDGFVSNKHFAGSKSTIINTEDETKGFNINNGIPRDWWEISSNVAKGNTTEIIAGKYATQKPEALLERIIKASSNEGMVVADFFGGSGVTAAVAGKLGRKFIHCDVNINSIQTARDRLVGNKAEFDMLEIKDGVSLFRNPIQTMDKLKTLISGLRKESSISDFWSGAISNSKLGMIPVYLPNLLDSSSKLLDIFQINRVVREALPDLPSGVKKVIVYYVDISDIKEIQSFIEENNDLTTIEVELRDLKEVLDDVVVEDSANFTVGDAGGSLFSGYKVEITEFRSDRVNQKIEAYNMKGEANKMVATTEDGDEPKKKSSKFKRIDISESGLETIEFLSLDCIAADGEWHSTSEIKIDKLGYVIRNGVKTKEFWDGTISSEAKPLRLKIRNICGDETTFNL